MRKCLPTSADVQKQCDKLVGLVGAVASIAGQKLETSCVPCDSDGCNGASQYGPVAIMIAIPVIIMNIASL